MIFVALALLAVAPPTAPAQSPKPDGEVVVTARSLSDLERAWRKCIKENCPPPAEMELAMAYAEAQLGEGDYRASWRTLRTTKGRNLRHADAYPTEVARIARATSRLAGLNGEPEVSRIAAVSTVDSLKAGLPSDDVRVLLAKLDVGDAFVTERRADSALAQYARVANEARKRQLPDVAAEADFRRAVLMTGLSGNEGTFAASARKALDRIIASDDPAMVRYRDKARLVRINLLPPDRQQAALQTVIPTLAPRPPEQALLVYAPLIDPNRLVIAQPKSATAQQWVDISYRIMADGTVQDVSPARSSSDLDRVLRKAAVEALKQRRYGPLALRADDPGPVRYARYTFVFDALAAGPIAEQSVRAKPIAPNEERAQDVPSPVASQIRPTSGEVVSRIPRYRTIPRIDVFDLGADLVRRDPSAS